MSSKRSKEIENMISERNALKTDISEIETRIFKIENEYLELTQGCSLFRNLEFYINTKPDKKRTGCDETDRVFSTNFPSHQI
ncbi:chromatin modification- protein eaf6 [Glugoides intestinalis]